MNELKTEAIKLIEKRTKNFLKASSELEDVFMAVQKIQSVVRPDDGSWTYLMNNVTTSVIGRSSGQAEWNQDQAHSHGQKAKSHTKKSGGGNFNAEMFQKFDINRLTYELVNSLVTEFAKENEYFVTWDDLPKDSDVSEVTEEATQEYYRSLGLL